MSTPRPNEKLAAVSESSLSSSNADLAAPPKAAVATTTIPAEKTSTGDLRRDSGPSTPGRNDGENPFDTDVEAMITATNTETNGQRKSVMNTNDCPTVWPSMQHWKQKAKVAKKTRHTFNCMGRMSKRNRIITKILIGLLIVGIGLGVGFGISRTLNAPIWGDDDD